MSESTEEQLDFQFLEELGEGLCNALEPFYGAESYPVAAHLIQWLRHEANSGILSELAAIMVDRGLLQMSLHARSVGWIARDFGFQISDSMDCASITSQGDNTA